MATVRQEIGVYSGSTAAQGFSTPQEILSELGRATTAYYEATPDKLEQARQEYEQALRKFNAASE